MKKSTKKALVATTLALSTVIAGSALLTGCGGGNPNWSKYDYFKFAEITEAEWNEKEIAYQFTGTGEAGEEQYPCGLNGMTGWVFLVNLYTDGSMIYLEGMSAEFPDGWNIPMFKDYQCRWVNFGYWKESNGKDTIDGEAIEKGNLILTYTHYYNTEEYEEEYCNVWKQTEVWAESDGTYTIASGSLTYWFMGEGTNGGNQEFVPIDLVSGQKGTAKYATFSAWYNGWKKWMGVNANNTMLGGGEEGGEQGGQTPPPAVGGGEGEEGGNEGDADEGADEGNAE